MRDIVDLGLRFLAHVIALGLSLGLLVVASLIIVVGIWGTGGFTADPPPDRPEYLGVVLVLAFWAAFQALIVWSWRQAVRALDRLVVERR